MSDEAFFDERDKLKGQPGIHALIIGVSDYKYLPDYNEPLIDKDKNFGLRKLSSPALTAYRIASWLIERRKYLPLPLATCRLLASPSAEELKVEAGLKIAKLRPTLDNVITEAQNWRKDARSHRENMTLFYFAGHGAQRSKGDHVMLLEEFGDGKGGLLRNAIETNDLFHGMAPSDEQLNIARTQLYFIDACRVTPKDFLKYDDLKVTPIYDVITRGKDDRVAPLFYAAVPGDIAIGVKGEQTIFSKALLQCLNGGAGVRVDDSSSEWVVTINSLMFVLQKHINKIGSQFGAEPEFRLNSGESHIILHRLEGPPLVNVVLKIDPPAAYTCTQVKVIDEQDVPVWELPVPLHPHPYCNTLPAGYYRIRANIEPPTPPYIDCKRIYHASPLNDICRVRVTPK